MSILLTLVYICSLVIYVDLALVNLKKTHIHTPLLRFFPLPSIKKSYAQSLKRDFYCVSDKVDVNGLTFNTLFLLVTTLCFLTHLFFGSYYPHQFWALGLLYGLYALYAMHTYRSRKEMCVYCKWTILGNPVTLVIMWYAEMDYSPYGWISLMVFAFLVSMAVRGQQRKLRQKQREKQMSDVYL